MARKSSTASGESPWRSAASRMPRAIGCSEARSSAAATPSTSRSGRSSRTTTSVTPKRPSVRVPVLSKTTACRSLARSKAARSRMSSPLRADSDVETATTKGTASPSACGQAITITVTVRSSAKAKSLPKASHTPRVAPPPPSATSVSQNAARFAKSWVRERVSCARRTSSMTCARYVSSPTRWTSIVRAPSPLIEPPITSSPGRLGTGADSPVSIASLTLDSPSTTTPSVGTFSPGRISTRSPARSSETGTSTIVPSGFITWASAGRSFTSSSRAREAPSTERISIQWPRSITSIRVASSQKKTLPGSPNTTAEE